MTCNGVPCLPSPLGGYGNGGIRGCSIEIKKDINHNIKWNHEKIEETKMMFEKAKELRGAEQ